MKKRSLFLSVCLSLLLYSTTSTSSPASIDYVNSRIKAAVDSVMFQLSQQNKKFESKINELSIVSLHKIGELYQGGIVIWVDDTKKHGLVVAKIDAHQGHGIQWQNGESGDKVTNARSDGIYAGVSNTHLIVSQQTIDDQDGNFAALSARSFSVSSDGVSSCTNNSTCYGNWYLPSLSELKLIRANLSRNALNEFIEGFYWTSTEVNVNQAFAVNWTTGESARTDKASNEPKVRPIHTF